MKKVLFIDRDGTLVIEPPVDYQLDAFEKLEFYPKVFRNLYFIRQKLDFEFVMVTNQDGLGTDSFPEDTFWPVHNLMLQSFKNEGIEFDDILIDRSFPEDNAPTRKPRTGMLTGYLNNPEYDLAGSFVIGDRATDVELAKNLGCKAILLQPDKSLQTEYGVEAVFDPCQIYTARWVSCDDARMLNDFEKALVNNVAIDAAGSLAYLAPNRVNLDLTQERWPKVVFHETREHAVKLS
jgi:imidazoleglycerol-phosphate dehydratase/histidinol-phosphatase